MKNGLSFEEYKIFLWLVQAAANFPKKPIKQDEEDYLFSFDYCVIFIPILLGTKSPTVLMGSSTTFSRLEVLGLSKMNEFSKQKLKTFFPSSKSSFLCFRIV